MRSKRGDQKYYILISAILGLMILAISLSWIFQEYFNGDDLDLETCRQSIILRAGAPEVGGGPVSVSSFKDDFPLKCKTSVVGVEENEINEIDNFIAEKMAECWALFGNGDINAFPPEHFVGVNSVCVPCARISLSEEAKKRLAEEGAVDIKASLNQRMTGREITYYNYLNNSGRKFPALFPAGTNAFDMEENEVFRVGTASYVDPSVAGQSGEEEIILDIPFLDEELYDFRNRQNGQTVKGWFSDVDLPSEFDPEKGDLIISYGVTIISGESEFGNYVPYLIYFQTGQEPEPFAEARKSFYDKAFNPINGGGLCETWEGVPA